MDYLLVKKLHMSFAAISLALFIFRSWLSVAESAMLKQKWLRILPHLNDTLLLSCAIYLCYLLAIWPFTTAWLTAKFLALLVYIALGTMAIKWAKTTAARLIYALSAISVFIYMLGVAIRHHPYSWFI